MKTLLKPVICAHTCPRAQVVKKTGKKKLEKTGKTGTTHETPPSKNRKKKTLSEKT